jgi:pilus assembly protein CpaD
MKLHHHLVAVGLALVLAACASQYTESEAPKNLVLDDASAAIDVRFAPGSNRLLAGDAARLRSLVARGAIAQSDRVTVLAEGPPDLATARFEEVAALLVPYRIVATPGPLAAVPGNRAIVQTRRFLVSTPPCPNWSKYPPVEFTNAHASNFGCTTAMNLAAMVASPADLAEGRPVGAADAIPAAAAVQRYQADKVQLPSATALTSIAAASTGATGSGATGAGTAGSQP